MNLFNNIQKVKYTRNQQEVVALKEYIIFDDEKLKDKYVVLKLANNLNQRLYDIKVEISQFDEFDELVEKTIISYNTKVEANDEFVPKAKLKVNYLCKSISFKLIYARFERLKYEGGEFFEIAHKFEEHHATLPPVKQAPIVEVVNKGKSKKEEKSKFSRRETYGKNIAKFPKFFNGFVIVTSIAFVVVSLIYFKKVSPKFTVNNVDYYIVSDSELAIVGYDGMDTEFTVPASIDDRKVTRITQNAFKNARLEKITIKNENFIIESNAFVNCKNLKEVYAPSKVIVLQEAFRNCTSLERVYMPTSNLLENTFVNVNYLESLTFDDTNLDHLVDAFVITNEVNINIKTLTTKMSYIPEGFLDNTLINSLDIPEQAKVGYGNYSHVDQYGYVDNGTVETIFGEVVSINTEGRKLIIDSNVSALDAEKFAAELSYIDTLVVEENNKDILNNQLYIKLYNLKTLDTFNLDYYGKDILNYCHTINTLICPVPSKQLSTFIGNKANITNLHLKGDAYLSKYMTSELPYLTNVKIDNNIVYNELGMFGDSYNLKSIEAPLSNTFTSFIDTFTTAQSIENIVITPQDTYIPYEFFKGLINVKSIEIKDGITLIDGNVVSNNPSLTSIKLPSNTIYNSYPVIGANCTSLTDVSYCANNSIHTYKEFNESSQYTKNLKVTKLPYIEYEYLEDVKSLSSLYIEGSSINYLGLLANQKSLKELYIKSDNLSKYFSDMFNTSSDVANNNKVPTSLKTVIIDCNVIPESYFEKLSGIENIYLQNVTEVSKNAFKEISGLKTVYIPSSLEVSKSLLSDFADMGVTLIFENKEAEYKGNYEVGVLFKDLYETL